jgi:hypothetical protein
MKIPFVKEWGSWVVFGASCLAGLIAGILMKPWEYGREFAAQTALTVAGLSFLINAKNPLNLALRSKGRNREYINWFLFFVIGGLILLYPFLEEGIKDFYIFSILIASYAVLLFLGKEHSLATELNGFALLTLSAPVVCFSVTGQVLLKLYAVVLIYFVAGVLKVRVRLKKSIIFRAVMILYCMGAVIAYYFMDVFIVLALPLVENVVSSIWMRDEKLRTTGNIELAKSIVFIILIGLFWRV